MEASFKSDFALFDTRRKDAWWAGPALTALGLILFFGYLTWAALQGEYFQFGNYLSPLYSPLILVDGWKWSPAFLILWVPGGFRLTCYYYRKAYYRSIFLDPPACAVGDSTKHPYRGEASFPLLLQNVHRYFLYLALIFPFFLWWDVIEAFRFEDGIGIGVGTLVLSANAFLLTGYTLSCHCFRHLIGGRLDCFSCTKFGQAQYGLWKFSSFLNRHHMLWAWVSLVLVAFTDMYIRLCSMGVIPDARLI